MNKFTLVISFAGTTALVATIGIITLAVVDRPIPDILNTLAIACVTGIVGLLARSTESTSEEVKNIEGRHEKEVDPDSLF